MPSHSYYPAAGAATAVRATLWDRACALSGPAAAGVYLAHMAHRQVEWMVRHHPRAVDAWLSTAEAVLAAVAQRTGFHAFCYTTSGLRKWDAPPSEFDQNPYWPHFPLLAAYAGCLGFAMSRGWRGGGLRAAALRGD